MLRSTCGGKKGNDLYEFDSPWSVASLFDDSSSSPYVLVADTNNRRVQCFEIEFNGQFSYKYTFPTTEKPYFVGTSKQHFAVSCEKGLVRTFLTKEKRQIAIIDMNKISMIQSKMQIVNKEYFFMCTCELFHFRFNSNCSTILYGYRE